MSTMVYSKAMKLRPTTPVSRRPQSLKGIATKSIIVVTALVTAIVGPMQMFRAESAYADSYDDKIAALNQQIAAYDAEAQKLAKKADSLQKQLGILANQKAAIEVRIDANQAKHDKLQQDIVVKEQKIADNREALGEILADLYVDDKISPLEMLASSDTISDFIDKQEYRASLRDTMSSTIEETKALKVKLEEDRTAVAKVLDEQKAQRQILAGKEAQRQQLLAQTKGSEARYKSMISDKSSQIAELQREAAAVRAAIAAGGNGASGGSASNVAGYPFYPNGCGFINDGYGYYRCQCVSYVAYRLAADSRNHNFAYLGNAEDWWDDGRAVPANDVQRGDVIVWLNGSPGHVMFVEGASNGTVSFTDFNGFGGALSPGQGTISAASATSYPMKVIRFR